MISGYIPTPVSSTTNVIKELISEYLILSFTWPYYVNLIAFESKFIKTCLSLFSSYHNVSIPLGR